MYEGTKTSHEGRLTMDVGFYLKQCDNHRDLAAFRDAIFATQRSQTGFVIKRGECYNLGLKQSIVSSGTAESEVQAMPSTAMFGESLQALLGSLGIPTPRMEVKCDNKAAIVLTTREGSWRTKALANEIYWIRDLVRIDSNRVPYVSTKEQVADILTKFLTGAQQTSARLQLSLLAVSQPFPEKPRVSIFFPKISYSEMSDCRTAKLRVSVPFGPRSNTFEVKPLLGPKISSHFVAPVAIHLSR